MKIGIDCDHGGENHKAYITAHLSGLGHQIPDYGAEPGDTADNPDIDEKLSAGFLRGELDRGIHIRGTGTATSIPANKIQRIRAAHVTDCFSARMAREHNDAQIICLGERDTGPDLALEIVDAYLGAAHQGGRHARRVEKIMNLQNQAAR